MVNTLPPSRGNNKYYPEVTWDNRDMNYKEDMIQKAIKDNIPTSI